MPDGRNIFSYIEWRGDLPLSRNPFNDIDSLALSIASYLNFDGIVPDFSEGEPILFPEAIKIFLHMPDSYRHKGLVMPEEIERFVILLSMSPRFRRTRLLGYRAITDEKKEMQFAACCFLLPNDTVYVAFRGTDDSLIGWKEDIHLSCFDTVPAQEEACRYLMDASRAFPLRKLRVGGHSKGGNLSIFAAVHADEATFSRILRVYSNDGPGFSKHFLHTERYRSRMKKFITFIPECSLVGTVLDHDERYAYIQSTATGVWQHDPFTWEIERNGFVILPYQSKIGERYTMGAKSFVETLSTEDRLFFSETLFEVLRKSGAGTLSDLNRNRLRAIATGAKTILSYDSRKRNRFIRLFHGLLTSLNLRPGKECGIQVPPSAPHPEDLTKKKPLPPKKQ